MPNITLVDNSSPGRFQIGDEFTLSITGGAINTPVYVTSTKDGVPFGTLFNIGMTDGSGNFSITDIWRYSDGVVGVWVQDWFVGNTPTTPPTLNFTLHAGTATVGITTIPSRGTGPDGNPQFQVGDQFTLTINGPLNQDIYVILNGADPHKWVGANTGLTGSWSITGIFVASVTGFFDEKWFLGPPDVGIEATPEIKFSVIDPADSGSATVTLVNNTRIDGSYQVGDSFTITVHGAANQPVFVSQNGGAKFQWAEQTDSSGDFSFTSTWTSADIGSFVQSWYVGSELCNPVLKFTVIGSQDAIDRNRYSKFNLIKTQVVPPGSQVLWYYSTDGGGTWINFNPATDVPMGRVPRKLLVKAVITIQPTVAQTGSSVFSTGVSPLIDSNHCGLGMIALDGSAGVFERNVVFSELPISVNFIIKMLVNGPPVGTNIFPKYSIDNGVTWLDLKTPVIQKVATGWNLWTFEVPSIMARQIQVQNYIAGDPADASKDPQVKDLEVIIY